MSTNVLKASPIYGFGAEQRSDERPRSLVLTCREGPKEAPLIYSEFINRDSSFLRPLSLKGSSEPSRMTTTYL